MADGMTERDCFEQWAIKQQWSVERDSDGSYHSGPTFSAHLGFIEGLRMAEEIVRGWTLRIGGQLEGSLANLKLEEGTGLQDLADAIRSEREKVERGQ